MLLVSVEDVLLVSVICCANDVVLLSLPEECARMTFYPPVPLAIGTIISGELKRSEQRLVARAVMGNCIQ